MTSYGDYTNSSSDNPSWSYGGTGASIWQTPSSLSSMHATRTTTQATVTVTRPTRGASSSSSSASFSTSSLLPDDIHWSSWPNSIAAAAAVPVDNAKPHLHLSHHHHHHRSELDRSSSPPCATVQPPEPDSSTLCMSNLEPWMDHEYASQVVRLMGWDRNTSSSSNNNNTATTNAMQNAPVSIKIPPLSSDSIPQHNNPGYCLITFPTAAHAAGVLASLHSLNHKDTSSSPLLMPNSSRPFNLQWASSAQLSQAFPLPFSAPTAPNPLVNTISRTSYPNSSSPQGQQQKEYSIFVGDLAPETSNSDLVAVFRNPVLGLRNDREPKFIRPFYSCKSAKIMLDPVTGVSRGYGFVRFTDEADQQRALIEMHGLYCLSRPMRVSPATAKFKSDGNTSVGGHQQQQSDKSNGTLESGDSTTTKPPLVRSVSSPVATVSATQTTVSHSKDSSNGSNTPDKTPAKTPNPEQVQSIQVTPQILAQIKELAAEGPPKPPSKEWNLAHIQQMATLGSFGNGASSSPSSVYGASAYNGNGLLDEAWNHQAQARAILGNLIGPNGEQLTSTDPYNTTVFVGGLSPLISEETLRTFFAPFGDIHYVKVPLGKHCGFVQFVRKADAERAIERMQGFPIGGSRIRLSWGRSQYKAAQAAAQAAQQAQVEHATRLAAALSSGQAQPMLQLTQEQAIQLLYSLGYNPQPAVSNSSDSQSTQYQHFGNQTIPTGMSSSGEEASQTIAIPGSSTLTIPLPRQYNYSQGFIDGLSPPSGQYTEDISPGEASLSSNGPNTSTTSRLANLTNLNSINGAAYCPYGASDGGGSSAFQASDILRNESHSPFAHVAQHQHQHQQYQQYQPQHSHSHSELSPIVRRTPPGMQSQHQPQQQQVLQISQQTNANKIIMRDDTNRGGQGVDYLTSSLVNLDMGHERFSPSRPTTLRNGNANGSATGKGNENGSVNGSGSGDGNDGLMNGTFRERRPLSNSISAPLNNLANGTAKLKFES